MPVSFTWMLNGDSVAKYKEINVASVGNKISVLSIDSITREHVGNYTCTTMNKAGISSFTDELAVKGTKKIYI